MTDIDEVPVGLVYGISNDCGYKVVIERFLYKKTNSERCRVLWLHPNGVSKSTPRKAKDIKEESKKSRQVDESEFSGIKAKLIEYDPTIKLTLTNKLE